jgi:hypothetical protein
MEEFMLDVLIAVVCIILGAIGSLLISRDTIKFSRKYEIANTIRTIFIEDRERIISLDANEDIESGDIVVENINKTDILIRNIFYYISGSKAENIKRHYNEYKEPYKSSHNAIVMLKGLREISGKPNNKSFLYTNNKIPNAKEIAIKHLKKLIDDFKRI